MKYELIASKKPNHWVCVDRENSIVCVFEHQNFDETQKFEFLDDIEQPNAIELAKMTNQMAKWLMNFHYGKIFPSDIRLRIGGRIAELRAKRGYSQEVFSAIIGIKQSNLSRIEIGKHSTGLDILGKIGDALGYRFDFIEE